MAQWSICSRQDPQLFLEACSAVPIQEKIAPSSAERQTLDPISYSDGLIAAIVLVHDLGLVNRRAKSFECTGIRLLGLKGTGRLKH